MYCLFNYKKAFFPAIPKEQSLFLKIVIKVSMLIKMEMNAAGSFEELAVKLIVVIRKIV